MKKLIIAAMLMFLGTSVRVSASNGGEKPLEKEKSTVENSINIGIGLEIDFGRRSRACDGRGLCRVKLAVETDPTAQGRFISNGNGTGDGTLTLSIPIDYIVKTQQDKMQNFKGQTEFVVEEDYTLPVDVSTKLGAKGTLTIKAGNYPMSLRDRIYTIIIGDML